MTQRDTAWLEKATTDEINNARRAGELNTLLGIPVPHEVSEGQLNEHDIEQLFAQRRYDEIQQARRDGRLSALLARKD